MPNRIIRCTAALLLVVVVAVSGCGADSQSNSRTKDNAPSQATQAKQQALRASLPFEDQRDFEEHQRGFIAAPAYRRIASEAGATVWDIGQYDFLLTGENYDSIHPSLQRQATLNMNYGLYEVVPGKIYQVRGFDLSNMTLI